MSFTAQNPQISAEIIRFPGPALSIQQAKSNALRSLATLREVADLIDHMNGSVYAEMATNLIGDLDV